MCEHIYIIVFFFCACTYYLYIYFEPSRLLFHVITSCSGLSLPCSRLFPPHLPANTHPPHLPTTTHPSHHLPCSALPNTNNHTFPPHLFCSSGHPQQAGQYPLAIGRGRTAQKTPSGASVVLAGLARGPRLCVNA